MPLVIANPSNVPSNALSLLQGNTAITNISNGTIAQGIVQAVSNTLNQKFTLLTTDLAQAFISTATGPNLDLIGILLNTPRGGTALGNSPSSQQFYVAGGGTFGDVNQIATLGGVIPAGVIVSNSSGSIQYQTTVSAPFNLTDSSVLTNITAITQGSAANIGANILTVQNLNFPGASQILTTNIVGINNGSDSQTDSEYRYFLSKAVTAAQAGNLTAILLAALSVPGVSNIIPIPYFWGVGTTNLIIVGTTPIVPQSVLTSVMSAVSSVTSISELVMARPPRYIGVEVVVQLEWYPSVTQDQKQSIATQVTANIYNYINNIQIGKGLVRDQLINLILNTSTQIQDIDNDPTSSTYMTINLYTPTTIDITNGVTTQNFIPTPLTQNYTAFFDDKLITMQSVNGYTYSGTAVTVNI